MDSFGRNKLHYLIIDKPESEHETGINFLVSNGIDINAQDKQGWSALHFAAQAGSVSAVKALIKHGANVNLKDAHGNSALFRAVFNSNGKSEIIKMLLNAGANPESKNTSGVSPKTLAQTIANYDIKQYFA